MCLGIPVKIMSIKDNSAVVSAGGAQKTIGIELTPDVKVGDYVLLHAGFAIEVISEDDAKETLKLLDEMFNAEDNEKRSRSKVVDARKNKKN